MRETDFGSFISWGMVGALRRRMFGPANHGISREVLNSQFYSVGDVGNSQQSSNQKSLIIKRKKFDLCFSLKNKTNKQIPCRRTNPLEITGAIRKRLRSSKTPTKNNGDVVRINFVVFTLGSDAMEEVDGICMHHRAARSLGGSVELNTAYG